jgi:hypothetical protein
MDFSLRGVDSFRIGTFSPSDQPRRNDFVVLSCYAYDFSPVCTEQVCELHNLDVFGMVDDATLWGSPRTVPTPTRSSSTNRTSSSRCCVTRPGASPGHTSSTRGSAG